MIQNSGEKPEQCKAIQNSVKRSRTVGGVSSEVNRLPPHHYQLPPRCPNGAHTSKIQIQIQIQIHKHHQLLPRCPNGAHTSTAGSALVITPLWYKLYSVQVGILGGYPWKDSKTFHNWPITLSMDFYSLNLHMKIDKTKDVYIKSNENRNTVQYTGVN